MKYQIFLLNLKNHITFAPFRPGAPSSPVRPFLPWKQQNKILIVYVSQMILFYNIYTILKNIYDICFL